MPQYPGRTVIKPPTEHITSGKIIKPSLRLMWKEFANTTLGCIFIWVLGVSIWIGFAYIFLVLDDGMPIQDFWNVYVPKYWPVAYLFAAGLTFVLILPTFILYPLYFRNIEYSIISKTGDTMPEVYVKKGLLNITKKHVPFRTITNISSKAGPMDRLFRIGTVEIQTAGGHSVHQTANEKLEGIVFFEEVRDFVLQELRKFRSPYTTATEIALEESKEPPKVRRTGKANEEMLMLLHEIRDILNRG